MKKTTNTRSTGHVFRFRRVCVVSVGAAVAAFTVGGSLMLSSAQESSAATPVSAAAVPFGLGFDDPPAPTNPADMPQDMPGMDMSGSSPAPTATEMPGDMPGMDMSGGHEHGSPSGAAIHRPLAPVLGTFGGGTAAVLLTAGMMRRKDREADRLKKVARLARRSRK